MFYKKRKWDENIGKLIVFAVTIIIAVSFVWITTYFYTKKTYEKKVIRVLWDIWTKLKTLNYLWICSWASNSKISYIPIKNIYTLSCDEKLWVDLVKYPDIFVLSGCKINDKKCIYKFSY